MGLYYNNILVAIDGSKEAEWAFKKAVEIAKTNNAKLLLAHVIETTTYAYATEVYDRTIVERGEKYATELLEKYKNAAIEAGVTDVNYVIELGSPKAKIPKDIAKKNNCDLIICGATGLNAVERFLMGSVSEGITRYAPCDVLVVRIPKEE